uniref:Uncharacterized protein n=1 Tax=Candidozyma auris TaxID=498019 RepID=A0A0L0P6G3_CANAR
MKRKRKQRRGCKGKTTKERNKRKERDKVQGRREGLGLQGWTKWRRLATVWREHTSGRRADCGFTNGVLQKVLRRLRNFAVGGRRNLSNFFNFVFLARASFL